MVDRVHTERFKGGQDDENSRPAMIEREWKVNKNLIRSALSGVMLLHDVIDVGHCGGNEEGEDEGRDIMVRCPEIDVDHIEDGEEGETP